MKKKIKKKRLLLNIKNWVITGCKIKKRKRNKLKTKVIKEKKNNTSLDRYIYNLILKKCKLGKPSFINIAITIIKIPKAKVFTSDI